MRPNKSISKIAQAVSAAAVSLLTLHVPFASAQNAPPAPLDHPLENPLSTTSIPALVGQVITIFTGIAGSIALLMFIYGGVLWIFSGGNDEKVTKGKDVMKWAVIGLAVMFGAYALVKLVFQGVGATA